MMFGHIIAMYHLQLMGNALTYHLELWIAWEKKKSSNHQKFTKALETDQWYPLSKHMDEGHTKSELKIDLL